MLGAASPLLVHDPPARLHTRSSKPLSGVVCKFRDGVLPCRSAAGTHLRRLGSSLGTQPSRSQRTALQWPQIALRFSLRWLQMASDGLCSDASWCCGAFVTSVTSMWSSKARKQQRSAAEARTVVAAVAVATQPVRDPRADPRSLMSHVEGSHGLQTRHLEVGAQKHGCL